ncbi:hypothetical protein [Streptomyces sp. NPDC014733]|uniref:hypothetical protein n=1 Tax=Streptomyces sp. NPDC014733 TaxID=3364885 RepID=UPI0036FCDC77
MTVDGEILGLAYSLLDVEEFLRRAGAEDPDAVLATEQGVVEWRGGGPDEWA